MSIPNLFHKIKSKTSIDKMTILFLFIIIGVGVGSFGLGRASSSVLLKQEDTGDIVIVDKTSKYPSTVEKEGNLDQQDSPLEKRYVSSKNGKMYYSIGCSGANRIKEENKIWFSTKEDAEKSGYALSTACK